MPFVSVCLECEYPRVGAAALRGCILCGCKVTNYLLTYAFFALTFVLFKLFSLFRPLPASKKPRGLGATGLGNVVQRNRLVWQIQPAGLANSTGWIGEFNRLDEQIQPVEFTDACGLI